MSQWLTENVGLITVFAIFFSPLTALMIQKKIENFNEKKQRKLNIFKTLLTYRQNRVSPEYVNALNLIDIEFYKDKEVLNAWRKYRDCLKNFPLDPIDQRIWNDNQQKCVTELLAQMSKNLNYDFNPVFLEKEGYMPTAHEILEHQNHYIREGFLDILEGKKSINVKIEKIGLEKKAPPT